MKKTISSMILFVAMLLMLAVSAVGCAARPAGSTGEEQPSIIGSWTATKLKDKASGTVYPIGEFTDGTFTAEFTGDGLCEYTIGGRHIKEVKWEETEDSIKILDQAGSIYVTKNEDGTLSIDYSEGGADYDLIYEKDK